MPNIENFLVYSHWQYDLVRHMFTLTVAVFAAGLVYFLATANQIAPRYRLSSAISAVVMTSAALEILILAVYWNSSFAYEVGRTAAATAGGLLPEGTGGVGAVFGAWYPVEGENFSNGFRYANWSIDVPMLLTQVLVVLGISGAVFWRTWWKFVVAGLLMIWTGYVGQYYEPAVAGLAPGVAAWPFWFWFVVSSVFWLYLFAVVWTSFKNPVGDMPDSARRALNLCLWILICSWTLYPIAYLIPAFWADGTGIAVRQTIFTVADITSKLVFGVVLSRAARLRSVFDEHHGTGSTATGRSEPRSSSL